VARRPWQPALSPNAWLRWEAIHRRLPTEARDVLEVGCGRGGFALRLANRYVYAAVEPDPASARIAQGRFETFGGTGDIRVGDLRTRDRDEQFDFVCAFEVVEHVSDDLSFVRECAARLRSGGTLMLTAPAGEQRFGASDEMVGHFRRYDVATMSALLRAAGLESLEVTCYGAPFAYVLEAVRDAIALARRRRTRAMSPEERTAASGRLLQPGDGAAAAAIWAAMLPLRKVQALAPDRGPSLLAVARRPASSST
jgi:SAM-dependent methyltransferase